MALAGISTLGVRLYVGYETVAGTKPATFTQLTRINSIGGLTITSENIDASALEDEVTRYVAGRGDADGSISVTVNLTQDTISEWEAVIAASATAKASNLGTWFQVYSPSLGGDSFFIVAEPPTAIPMPETNQNELWTVEMTLTVNEYKGMSAAVIPN